MKLPPNQRERAPQCAGTRKRSEITRAFVLLDTRQRKPRNRIAQIDLHHEETLVVPKTDVVARVKFLDELAFQQQRFRLTADEVKIEIVDGFDQRLELQVPTQPARGLEIKTDTLAQIAGLADVNDGAKPVAHQVNARSVRQRTKFLAYVIGYCHADTNLRSQLRIFHEGVAKHVADSHLRIFDPPIMRVIDDQDLFGNFRHA